MSVLLWLTLLYVAGLILVLAGGLIAIVYYLNRARASLAQIATGLVEVDRNVEPLQNALTATNDGLATLLSHLQRAQENLSGADARLEEKRRVG